MTYPVLADLAASITDLKKDPMGTIREAAGETVVILKRTCFLRGSARTL
jgi:antitoxin StbD